MAYHSLAHFIEVLEREGELIRIKTPVSPHLEIAEITDRVSKVAAQNKALLFEQTGTDFPLLINALGSERRICLALGVADLEEVGARIQALFADLTKPREGLLQKLALLPALSKMAQFMPKVLKKRGACQEVVEQPGDITKLPVLTCWPKDGGAFFTLPMVHTLCPHTGQRNLGLYRMQVFGAQKTAMHWHRHKVSAAHFERYKALGKKMLVAVALGGDPVYTYAATAPLPENVDEYILAGFLRKKSVALVPCITQPEIAVPEDADIVLEGYVDPAEAPLWEGPFGDHTGFYSLPDWYPAFHITAVTYKKRAIFPATIVGVPPQEDTWIGRATERIFLSPIRLTMLPELQNMRMPEEGVFHNLVLAQIKKTYPAQAFKVINALWGAGQMMFNKVLVVTDETLSLGDYEHLLREGLKRYQPKRDTQIFRGPMDVLDHSCSALGMGGKMGIDWTNEPSETPVPPFSADIAALCAALPEITHINNRLWAQDIPILFIFLKKTQKGQIRNLHRQLRQKGIFIGCKAVIYLNDFMQTERYDHLLWMIANHIDPMRDAWITEDKEGEVLALDASVKTRALDDFVRDWPNPVLSDSDTIHLVDTKWAAYGLGDFIVSPSLPLWKMALGKEAQV